MNKGQVVEEGTHWQLLNEQPNSLYAQLWNIQENLDIEKELLQGDEEEEELTEKLKLDKQELEQKQNYSIVKLLKRSRVKYM